MDDFVEYEFLTESAHNHADISAYILVFFLNN